MKKRVPLYNYVKLFCWDLCANVVCNTPNNAECQVANGGTCSAGVCNFQNQPQGTLCNSGTFQCDGNGACVSMLTF